MADLRELRRQGQRHRLRLQGRRLATSVDHGAGPRAQPHGSDDARTANRYLKRIRYGNRAPYLPELTANLAAATDPALPGADELDVRSRLRLRRGTTPRTRPMPTAGSCAPVDRRPTQVACARRSVLHLPRRLRGPHLPPLPARADVPPLPGRARRTATTAWCAPPTSPTRTKTIPTDVRNPIYSFLHSVTQSGYTRQPTAATSRSRCRRSSSSTPSRSCRTTVDEVDPQSLENLPVGLDGSAYQWIDLTAKASPASSPSRPAPGSTSATSARSRSSGQTAAKT